MRLVLATRNKGKLAEIQAILDGFGAEVVGLDQFPDLPEVVEDGETFEANALKKARAAAVGTGLPALADDSGLVVDALDGEPGVYSARYGGPGLDDAGRNGHLLAKLAERGVEHSAARFHCVMALVNGAREVCCEGVWEGVVQGPPIGEHGFGYDPLFHPNGGGATAATLPADVKNAQSHRGQALQALLDVLRRDPKLLG